MFAFTRLITYPIVSKFGIMKNRAVNIAVGSTLLTNVLALTVLAIVVEIRGGDINRVFWIKLAGRYLAFFFGDHLFVSCYFEVVPQTLQ